MGYKFYYRDVESGPGTWKSADESELDAITKDAFHLSTLFFSELPVSNATADAKIRLRGDFWIDIDNKDKLTSVAMIERSIEDVRALHSFLISAGVDVNSVALYLSGGKGFHVRIPSKVMSAIALTKLNLIYKDVATYLTHRTGAKGIDLQIYKGGKGSLIRVENKKRADGKYKVQIAWHELNTIDVESYYNLASAPRASIPLIDPIPNSVMIGIFNDALIGINQAEKLKKVTSDVAGEHLAELKGKPAPCFSRLCNYDGMKAEKEGLFNLANQTFARGIVNSGFSDREVEQYIQMFAENSTSRKRPSIGERERDIRYAIATAQEQQKKFSCGYFKDIMNDLPCKTCTVYLEQGKERASRLNIEEIGNSYSKPPSGKRTEPITLADFRLEPVKVSYEVDDKGNPIDQTYTFIIHFEDKDNDSAFCTIKVGNFQSKSKFKDAIQYHPQAIWYGKDEDVDALRKYLTSKAMLEGVEKVVPVKKQGISRVLDAQLGVDEYAWVQMGWSWNGSVPNTVEYHGPRNIGETGEVSTCAVNLKDISAVETAEAAKIFKSLIACRGTKEVAIILGWMGACWLKPQVTSVGYDSLFPILHAYGIAGSGKTELTKTFAILAGYDGIANETINVSNCTAYYLKATACSTTTIPQIYDEFNSTKISDEVKRAVREVIKSSATKQIMGKGKVTGSGDQGGVVTESSVASSPLIMLSTAQNQEAEIIERSVILYLNKDDIYRAVDTKYLDAHDEVMMAKHLLFSYTKMLMHKAISITSEELTTFWNNTSWLSKPISDQRKQKGMRLVVVGLQFVISAFKEAGCSAETIRLVENLLDEGIAAYLADPRYRHLQDNGRSETDNVVDLIIGMAQLDDSKAGGSLIKDGTHYIVSGTDVHFKLNAIYVYFKKYTKDMGIMVEYDTVKGFIQALENCNYYLGTGKTPGVSAPTEWHTFSIQGLIDKNIDVTRLHTR